MLAVEDKRLEVSITAAALAQATAHFKTCKPRTYRHCKPNDKQDKPDKNKAKPKDRTGGRSLPSTDKAQRRPRPTRRNDVVACRVDSCTPDKHASPCAAKLSSIERYRRERTSLEVDRQARHESEGIYCRPTAPKQLLRLETATYGVNARSSTPNEKGRLHIMLQS
jgi:hypothetical protein